MPRSLPRGGPRRTRQGTVPVSVGAEPVGPQADRAERRTSSKPVTRSDVIRFPSISNTSETVRSAAKVHIDRHGHATAGHVEGSRLGTEVVEGEGLLSVVPHNGVDPLESGGVDDHGGRRREEGPQQVAVLGGDGREVVVDEGGRSLVMRREVVEPPGIEAEDLGLHRSRARGDRGPDGVNGSGEGGVVMGVVAAPHDRPGANEGCQGREGALVDFEADGALPGEVLRWCEFRSGQKPPKDSACSSSRSSQKGAHPPRTPERCTAVRGGARRCPGR